MRGRRTLDSIVYGERADCQSHAKRKVCRDPELIRRRNEILVHRYFFLVQKNTRYETVVKTLSDEFYLSTVTIAKILTDQVDRLLQIKREKPSIKELK